MYCLLECDVHNNLGSCILTELKIDDHFGMVQMRQKRRNPKKIEEEKIKKSKVDVRPQRIPKHSELADKPMPKDNSKVQGPSNSTNPG